MQESLTDMQPVTKGPGSRWWPIDLRWLLGRLYADDPVNRMLMRKAIPLTASRLKSLWALVRSVVYEEWIRFQLPFPPRRPNGVAIEITNACNLRCRMCNLVSMKRSPRFMEYEVYTRIIDRVAEARVENLRLHTYGETLLHSRLVDMLAYARRAGLRVWISTNAQLLNDELGQHVLMAGVHTVRYSVEGASAEVYERIRKGGCWKTLLENMRVFRANRDRISPGTVIALNSVVMAETIDEIAQYEVVYGPYVDEIHFSPLEALGTDGWKLSKSRSLETVDLGKRIPCRLLWDMMNIAVDGTATLCCADVEADVPVGNVLKQPISAIWRGLALTRARALHRRGRFEELPICTSCSFGVTNTAINRFRYALLNDRKGYGRKVR